MADERGKGIDPRYDPAFQRGYHGPSGEAERIARDPDQTSGPGGKVGSRQAARPVVRPGEAIHADAALPDRTSASGTTEPEDAIEMDDAGGDRGRDEASDPVAPPLRENPYAYALGVMGALFVLGGIGINVMVNLVSYSGQEAYRNPPVLSMVVQNVAYVLAEPLITVGLAILAGLVFLAGSRWSSQRKAGGR